MLTREQKDQLEGLVQLPEVCTVYIRTSKNYNDVSIHLEDRSNRTPIEEAVRGILTTLEIKHRRPIDKETYLLYSTEIRAEEANADIYVSEVKEVSADVEAI
jgi:hypothetical protein